MTRNFLSLLLGQWSLGGFSPGVASLDLSLTFLWVMLKVPDSDHCPFTAVGWASESQGLLAGLWTEDTCDLCHTGFSTAHGWLCQN